MVFPYEIYTPQPIWRAYGMDIVHAGFYCGFHMASMCVTAGSFMWESYWIIISAKRKK